MSTLDNVATATNDGLVDEELPAPRPYFSEKGHRFLHENCARDLIELHHARLIDGVPAVWDSMRGRYAVGFDAWSHQILRMAEGTTIRQRREVTEWLCLEAPKHRQGDVRLIACDNGVICPWTPGFEVLDPQGHSAGFLVNSPELNVPNVLAATWDPSAYDEATDCFLDDLACNDPSVRLNLEEILAASIYRGTDVQAMPVLIGSGGNGKSTYLRMLTAFVGADNVSSIGLGDLGRRFMQAPLVGKLANVGDDIADGFIDSEALAVIRKIATGEALMCEEKFRQPIRSTLNATLVFSANEFPRLADTTTGMTDRIHGVRFAADFRHDPERRVTGMADKLDNARSRSYLLNLALRRLPGLVARGSYTSTAYSSDVREGIVLDGDSVAFWIDSEGITWAHVDGRPVSEIYESYSTACALAGRKPVEQRTFARRVNKVLGTVTAKDVYQHGRQVRGFHRHSTR